MANRTEESCPVTGKLPWQIIGGKGRIAGREGNVGQDIACIASTSG
jgi:hypothetical protein